MGQNKSKSNHLKKSNENDRKELIFLKSRAMKYLVKEPLDDHSPNKKEKINQNN